MEWCFSNASIEKNSVQCIDLKFTADLERDKQLVVFEYEKLSIINMAGEFSGLLQDKVTHPRALELLVRCLELSLAPANSGQSLARFVGSSTKGNIVRSNIFSLRLVDIEQIATVISLATPLQHYTGQSWREHDDLWFSIADSACGMIVRSQPHGCKSALEIINHELRNRMSFDWIIPGIRRKTIAILEGSETHPSRGGTGPSIYEAAQALGIDVLVLAVEGHWLQGSEFAVWRKRFLPVDLWSGSGLSTRIVEAIRTSKEHVDGLITHFDMFQIDVALAAVELGLPAEPAAAYQIIANKHESSAFEGHCASMLTFSIERD